MFSSCTASFPCRLLSFVRPPARATTSSSRAPKRGPAGAATHLRLRGLRTTIAAGMLGLMSTVCLAQPRLDALVDQGSHQGRHYFELWGTFPGDRYFARVVCNGVEITSRREYHAPTKNQINVSFEEQRTGATCSVIVTGRVGDSYQGSNALAPRLLRAPPLEITGIRDQGLAHGKRYFELYGTLNGHNQSVATVCNGKTLPTTVSWPGTGRPDNYQINIALSNYPTGPTACDLSVRGRVAGRDQTSPAFHYEGDIAPELLPSFLGIYFWGGYKVPPDKNQIGLGAADLHLSGFSTLRLIMTPRVRGELIQGNGLSLPYGFREDAFRCADKPFLACAAASEQYRSAMGNAQARTVVLTVYDAVTSGDTGWNDFFLNPEQLYRNQPAIIEEYRALTVELHRQYANTGKTFILSNWEADNHVFCGNPGDWTRHPGNRRAECSTPEKVRDRLLAIATWFKLRQLGIRRGVRDALAQGLTGVTVSDAIEFNAYQMARDVPGNVLSYVIPYVRPEWALYSSYETINKLRGGSESTVSNELRMIKRHLVEQSPGTQLAIGEMGFRASEGSGGSNQVPFTVRAARAVYDADIQTAILWVAYDSSPQCDPKSGKCESYGDGFVHRDGRERWIMKNLRSAVGSWPERPRVRLDRATAVIASDGTLTAVLNGAFPGADRADLFKYEVKAVCDGVTLPETPRILLRSPAVLVTKFRPWRACPTDPCTSSCQFAVHRVGTSPRVDDYTQSMLSTPVVVSR